MDDPGRWLHEFGWDVEVATLAEVTTRYGRWPYAVRASRGDAEGARVFLITAERR